LKKWVFKMYDTAERVRQVRLRAGQLQRQMGNRLLGGLGPLCAMLVLSLIGAIGTIAGGRHGGTVPGLYGAMLLCGDAGGYVFAAVLSFAAAVIITVLCIWYRAKSEKHNKSDKEGSQEK
jgi:uncharacterized membrane protein